MIGHLIAETQSQGSTSMKRTPELLRRCRVTSYAIFCKLARAQLRICIGNRQALSGVLGQRWIIADLNDVERSRG